MNHKSIEETATPADLSNTAAVSEVEPMMTTQEATACLGVSLAYLLGLPEEGKLTYEELGQEQRLQKAEVFAYQQRRREEGYAALREMVRLNQEMGLYD